MTLHVEHHGVAREGRPDLVLLHGWAMHGGVFAGLLDSLSQTHRVIVIDLPGHGRSALTGELHSLDTLAQQVQPHVPAQAIVLGWSLGGLLAVKLAQLMPLHALVLVSTTPRFVADASWRQGMAEPVFAQFFARLQHNMTSTVQDFLALQVRGDSDADHTLQQLQQVLLAHPAEEAALRAGLTILRDADERAALPTLTLPTLVIAGEYDRITHPRASSALADQLPQAQLQIMARAGHAPFISHRESFLSLLHDFLHKLPPVAPLT